MAKSLKDIKKIVKKKPEIICVQETWLKPALDFIINGYDSICRDRGEGCKGGYMVFLKQGMHYRVWGEGTENRNQKLDKIRNVSC